MNYSVHVISLQNEKQRRKYIKKQLDDLSIEFSFFDAIDLRGITDRECISMASCSKFSSIQRNMTKGEVGCALSHLTLYGQISRSTHEWHLILEDDAILNKITKAKIIDITKKINEDAGVVILGYSKLIEIEARRFYIQEPIKQEVYINDMKFGRVWKNWTSGTVGYLINRQAASSIYENFCQHNGLVQTLADDWNYFEQICNVKILHARPLLIYENFDQFESSIEDDRSTYERKHRRIFGKYMGVFRIIRGILRKIAMVFRV